MNIKITAKKIPVNDQSYDRDGKNWNDFFPEEPGLLYKVTDRTGGMANNDRINYIRAANPRDAINRVSHLFGRCIEHSDCRENDQLAQECLKSQGPAPRVPGRQEWYVDRGGKRVRSTRTGIPLPPKKKKRSKRKSVKLSAPKK